MKVLLRIDEKKRLHTASPLLFGQFIEHFGRCVYGGIFEVFCAWAVLDARRRLCYNV